MSYANGPTNWKGENRVKTVITFGTFDLLHEGHLKLLKRARALGDRLVVGVSSDQLNDRKGKRSIFPEAQRMSYVAALRYVDEVFLEESLELKDSYIRRHKAELLVMGDDWAGKFDWVTAKVTYLPRTEGISSTLIKTGLKEAHRCTRALFGDTYLTKHFECAMGLVNSLTERNVAPILTPENTLRPDIDGDLLLYFNKPENPPSDSYAPLNRVLIDHGASHLKWFLGCRDRFDFFDTILTAGPDHVRALEAIFDDGAPLSKARATGFVKSRALLAPPGMTRAAVCGQCGLDPEKPIILFAPTWHITANDDILTAIGEVQKIDNHVAALHPETAHLETGALNLVENRGGIMTELLKHADLVISDLSSTIYEAAALSKPVVQILLKEYPDNTALLYDFPLTAGTAEHFCGGLTCRPEGLRDAVSCALSGEPSVMSMMAACRARILNGTFITPEATDHIADEIARLGTVPPVRHSPATSEPKPPRPGPPRHRQNLFFAQERIIGHAGGNFAGHYASNSREAMEAALNAVNIVELDMTMGANGVIVAHEGFEPRYGLSRDFADTTSQAFLATTFENRLSPVRLEDAVACATRPGKALVCDVKPGRDGYKTLARAVRDTVEDHGQIEQIVLQCYAPDDFAEAMRLGFKRVILAARKYYYRAPIGADYRAFVRDAIAINADAVWGLSLPWRNKHMEAPVIDLPEFPELFAFWKRIFIHGAPPEEYPRILRMNCGLFADGIDRQHEFRHLPKGFDWRRYLFLNRDLIRVGRVTEVEAMAHFIKHGAHEGRPTDYAVPEGFDHGRYVDRNPKLRKASVNAFHSAAAHYTLYGAGEGLTI